VSPENSHKQKSFENEVVVLVEHPGVTMIGGLIAEIQSWGKDCYQRCQEEIEAEEGWPGLLVAAISHNEGRLDQYHGYCRLLIPKKEGKGFPLPVRFYCRDRKVDFGVANGLIGVRAVPQRDGRSETSLTQETADWVPAAFIQFLEGRGVLRVSLQQQRSDKGWNVFLDNAPLLSIIGEEFLEKLMKEAYDRL
jgi:hypothetical protein